MLTKWTTADAAAAILYWRMSFGSPIYLFALLVVPLLLAIRLVVRRRRSRHPVAFTNLDLLATVKGRRRPTLKFLPVVFLLFSLACAGTALAMPRLTETEVDGRPVVVILVDVSGSMQSSDIAPTRITAAKSAMQTFVEKLPGRAEVGLVEFSSDPTTVELPTTDHGVIEDDLSLFTAAGATALGDGLATAVNDVEIADTHARRMETRRPGSVVPGVIVLESDGAQNTGTLQPLEAAARAKKAGIRVYTVAFGTARGTASFVGAPAPVAVPPDPLMMRAIARLTGGTTFTARSASQATSIYRQLGSTIVRTKTRDELASWLAFAAGMMLLAAVCLRVGVDPVFP